MAEPRAFISFDVDHNSSEKVLFAGQAFHSKTPFSHEDWSAKSPMPQAQWEALVKAKINKTHMMIVLVGRHMATAIGVVKEIEMARSQDVPVFGVYVDGADTSSTLPTGLNRNRVIQWTWDGIGNAVDQMMKQGKNKS
ncbi:TIR domain-containing protein [Methylobacter sp. G7]|uniref:TIR domain-containing protein n=1 Tax=Methylobacter sp. G7 TaxID=3230117 RepID=UPI003D803C2A